MPTKLPPNDIERLRREAKQISRDEGCTYTEALDRQAVKIGYPNWALMQHAVSTTDHAAAISDL